MLDWLCPQVVEKIYSAINGQIKVLKSRGQYSVWVGGFEQSGNFYVAKIWKKKLDEITRNISEVLILGLGCGTVAKLVSHKWPKAKITGVEIDPVMIALGRKYFGLSKISNLAITNTDATKFVEATKCKFDLVVVDTYIGNRQKRVATAKKVLSPGGILIVNYLVGVKNELVLEY